jgi:hypothetical protein
MPPGVLPIRDLKAPAAASSKRSAGTTYKLRAGDERRIVLADRRDFDLSLGDHPRSRARGPRPYPPLPGAGYDVLRFFASESDQSVTLFGRYDYADTQADVPSGVARRDLRPHRAIRPIKSLRR